MENVSFEVSLLQNNETLQLLHTLQLSPPSFIHTHVFLTLSHTHILIYNPFSSLYSWTLLFLSHHSFFFFHLPLCNPHMSQFSKGSTSECPLFCRRHSCKKHSSIVSPKDFNSSPLANHLLVDLLNQFQEDLLILTPEDLYFTNKSVNSLTFSCLANHRSTSSNAHIFFAQQESSLANGLTISHCFHTNFFEF